MSRARSCLRPFDAEGMHPLALMIRPRGSSPPSFARARTGAGRYSGFQAFSVGSNHFVGALDADRPRRRKLLIDSLVRSGRDRSVVVSAAPRHQHEDDARDLVGERHRGQIELVFDGLALEHPARLWTQGVVMTF